MTAFILLAVATAALAVISCIPDGESIYTSLPMVILWGAVAIASLTVILRRKLYRRTPVFMLHASFLIILAGAFLTWLTGSSSTVRIPVGGSALIGDMEVELTRFDIEYYPGTHTPADFISTITVDGDTAAIAMNKPFSAKGYRMFQSAYDPDLSASVFTVSHDPAGTPVTYAGYALLFLSMILYLLPKSKKKIAVAAAVLIILPAKAAPSALPADVARSFGDLFVYADGRIMPVSTLARNFTVKLTGSESYQGLTPEQVFTGWLFYYDSWKKESCIKISDADSRRQLGIDSRYASINDFFGSDGTYLLSAQGHEAANERFALASAATVGSIWRIFPYAGNDGSVEWYSPIDRLPAEIDVDRWHFIEHCLNYIAELVADSRWDEVNAVVDKIHRYQISAAGNMLPTTTEVTCEQLFVRLAPMTMPALLLIAGGIILFFLRIRRRAIVLPAAGLLWVVLLIALNWIASGSVPMSDGYQTMQWMAMIACMAGIILGVRHPSMASLCAVTAGLALLVAKMGHANPQITDTVPVLRSPLLSVHVLTVMAAYALLALMALCGAAWLAGRRQLIGMARRMLRPALFLLTAGIFIGAIWANQSWGRYWGWDPKEVWALITMVIYCFPLHSSSMPRFNSDRFFAIYILVAFLSVIMTYCGVNFILGGLHSYA